MIKYQKTTGLTDKNTHYCPGCTHGILHKVVAEVLEEMNLLKDTVGVASVGCSVYAYDYFNCDMQQAAHGRACAVATGIKRVLPERVVFTYQGDGDLASIGIGETIHAANRGENITVIFANNAIYGMTGGQMAPTSLKGQITTTSSGGRDPFTQGYPIRVSEMLAQLNGPSYIERVTLTSPQQVRKAKAAIKKAFTYQLEGRGFSMIEVLSSCPVNWGMSPQESLKWIDNQMTKVYPLGVFKDVNNEPHD